MQSEILHVLQFTYNSLLNPTAFPTDHYGRTPLHYAVGLHTTYVLETLLGYGWYDVNHMDCLHQTTLQKAMQLIPMTPEEHLQKQLIVLKLLCHGANPNLHHPSDLSPLMIAALQEDTILVHALLLAGADPNARLITDGLFFMAGESALSLLARKECIEENLSFLPNDLGLYDSHTPVYKMLHQLIHHDTSTPNTIFHALQKAKGSMRSTLRQMIQSRESA